MDDFPFILKGISSISSQSPYFEVSAGNFFEPGGIIYMSPVKIPDQINIKGRANLFKLLVRPGFKYEPTHLDY